MKNIFWGLALVFVSWNLTAEEFDLYYIDYSVHENADLKFLSHRGEGRLDSYLSMEVQYPPVKKVYDKIQEKRSLVLKNRGEAHITVVTPIEYYDVLKSKISIQEIEELAIRIGIQSADFKIKCLGRGKLKVNNKTDETYYIVVDSDKLLAIRKEIQSLFEKKGGLVNSFNAATYYPHITVGFTSRDLHESDGVIKNSETCISDFNYNPKK